MKILKNIGIIIGVIGISIMGILFFSPPVIELKRSININTEPERIYRVLKNYREYATWSPWADIDFNTEYTYKGPRTGVGSTMLWTSDSKEVGNGKQWIIESKENSYIKQGLDFGTEGVHTSEFILKPILKKTEKTKRTKKTKVTEVTWTYRGDLSNTGMMTVIGAKFFGLFVMDSMLGDKYDEGLLKLKEVVEKTYPIVEDFFDFPRSLRHRFRRPG